VYGRGCVCVCVCLRESGCVHESVRACVYKRDSVCLCICQSKCD
jgi:hypothetical protein